MRPLSTEEYAARRMPASDDSIELAEIFADMARELLSDASVEETLEKISRLAVKTIDGCDHAGVSLVEGRRVVTHGASDDVPEAIDIIQYETDQGPCLDAIREHEVFIVDHLGEEDRWSAFASRAATETGVASILSFRLFVDEDTLGALNLYSRNRAAFGDAACQIGAVFAAHAAVAFVTARQRQDLERQIDSRDIIGQAKGILMARTGATEDQAFDMLRRASQHLNMKLRTVAEEVARTGETPES